MIDLALLGLLLVMVLMGSLASVGWDTYEMRNRENWWWACVLGMECVLMYAQNPYLAAMLAFFTVGLWQIGRSWYILRGITIPTAAMGGVYILMVPHMGRWMVSPILWSFVAVGVGLGIWGIMGYLNKQRPYNLVVPPSWFGMWGIYEHGYERPHRHLCGQGNTLHLSSVSSLTVAAAVGLIIMGQWWAAFCLPFCLLPLALIYSQQVRHNNTLRINEPDRFNPGQGGMNLGVLAVGLQWIYFPVIAVCSVILIVGGIVAALAIAKPWTKKHKWMDSGRLAYWVDALGLIWWPAGWQKRLFGFGTSTWFLSTVRMAEQRKHINVYTAAHNEFIQQLLEHGIIGFLALAVYVGEALWRTSHGGPEGAAVFLLGLTVCSIASVNFPFTFFHEYHPSTAKEESWYGSPTLNVLCFVVALLVEAIH